MVNGIYGPRNNIIIGARLVIYQKSILLDVASKLSHPRLEIYVKKKKNTVLVMFKGVGKSHNVRLNNRLYCKLTLL